MHGEVSVSIYITIEAVLSRKMGIVRKGSCRDKVTRQVSMVGDQTSQSASFQFYRFLEHFRFGSCRL